MHANEMDMENREKVMHVLLDFSEQMMLCGAEVSRVEDTMKRLGVAYGAEKVHTFVITSSIILTLLYADGRAITQSRRITRPAGTDFSMLENLNMLSRRAVNEGLSLEELSEGLSQPRTTRQILRFFIGSSIVGFSFTMFFGGSWKDGIAGLVYGAIVALIQYKIDPFCPNRVVFNLFGSFFIGLLVILTAKIMPFLNPDMIIIGVIMLMIPGLALTISIRDVIVGETISGTLRLLESFLCAVALACGMMLAIRIVG